MDCAADSVGASIRREGQGIATGVIANNRIVVSWTSNATPMRLKPRNFVLTL